MAGENWDAANEEAVKAGRKENTFLVHPFDQVRLKLGRPGPSRNVVGEQELVSQKTFVQATTWEGHSTLVEEVSSWCFFSNY